MLGVDAVLNDVDAVLLCMQCIKTIIVSCLTTICDCHEAFVRKPHLPDISYK